MSEAAVIIGGPVTPTREPSRDVEMAGGGVEVVEVPEGGAADEDAVAETSGEDAAKPRLTFIEYARNPSPDPKVGP
jgi:hypothetical protein